jgi:hypothetical protein
MNAATERERAIQRRAIAYVLASGGHVNPRILSFQDAPADVIERFGTPGSAVYGRTVVHVEWSPDVIREAGPLGEEFLTGGLDLQVDGSAYDVLHSEWLRCDIDASSNKVAIRCEGVANTWCDDPEIQAIQGRALAFAQTCGHVNPRIVSYETAPEDVVALFGTPSSTLYGRTLIAVDWSAAHRAIARPEAKFLDAGLALEVDCSATDVIQWERLRWERH